MTALPPQPDPETGEPHPPRAPAVVGAWAGYPEDGRRTNSPRPAEPQSWFAKSAPILELVEGSRRHGLGQVAVRAVFTAIVLGGGLALVQYGSPELRDDPVPYVIVGLAWLVSVVVSYVVRRTHTVYAGAAWAGDGEDEGKFVWTYDLARIKVDDRDATLTITAPNDLFLKLPLGLLEGNPALWDLIYNGLRHSVAAGAEIDPETRRLLRLP